MPAAVRVDVWLHRVSYLCVAVTAACAVSTLIGSLAGSHLLTRLVFGLSPMKADSAVCFLLGSVSVVAYGRCAAGTWPRQVAAACAALIVLIGAVALAEYLFGLGSGIDRLILDVRADVRSSRPAANTAVVLTGAGMALLCWDLQVRGWWVSHMLAWLCGALCVLALLGFATGAASVIEVDTRHRLAANSSIVAGILLTVGILLARPDRGQIAALIDGGQRGVMLRRLLPAALVLPAALASLTFGAEQLGLVVASLELWIFATAVTAALVAVAWLVASASARVEHQRLRVMAELEDAQRIARLGSWWWDQRSGRAKWSAQADEIVGLAPFQGPGTLLAGVAEGDRERVAATVAQGVDERTGFELECRLAGSGTERIVHVIARPDSQCPGCLVGTVQDVTAQRTAEVAVTNAEERFRRAFDEAPIGMALITPEGRFQRANGALGIMCGRPGDELAGMRLADVLHPGDVEAADQAVRALTAGELDQLAVELRTLPVTGAYVDMAVHGTRLRSGGGQPQPLLWQFEDVTERKQFETRLRFMADHDPLTGLMNRRRFEIELDRHVAQVKRYGAQGALLVLDLDHFKSINDTLGHNAGDELIVSTADVLRQRVRASDLLARLGGDEFAVLLPKADESEAARVAQALAAAVRTNAALLGGERKRVTTSLGIAMFKPRDGAITAEAALVEADLAMYDAKEDGGNRHAFYATSDHPTSRTKARLTWINRIEEALQNDRLTLAAQPILDLQTGRIRQHELLVRMLADGDGRGDGDGHNDGDGDGHNDGDGDGHNDGDGDGHNDGDGDGLIPPASFLYIAERFGIIGTLDTWVVTRAIRLIEQRPDLHLEVNISGSSLGDAALLETIDQCLRATGIDPTHLIFEVTETAAVANVTDARAFAQHLRDLGCRFALDDFGAGFGSFYYLKHLPFDYVKIDGEFVQHATNSHIDQLVIEAVVRIARGLGKETIAEFVTTETTQRMLRRLNVDYAQGYHIGKPFPASALLTHQVDADVV